MKISLALFLTMVLKSTRRSMAEVGSGGEGWGRIGGGLSCRIWLTGAHSAHLPRTVRSDLPTEHKACRNPSCLCITSPTSRCWKLVAGKVWRVYGECILFEIAIQVLPRCVSCITSRVNCLGGTAIPIPVYSEISVLSYAEWLRIER